MMINSQLNRAPQHAASAKQTCSAIARRIERDDNTQHARDVSNAAARVARAWSPIDQSRVLPKGVGSRVGDHSSSHFFVRTKIFV